MHALWLMGHGPWQWQAARHNKDAVQPCQNSGLPVHTAHVILSYVVDLR